jgi:hypothetical protein
MCSSTLSLTTTLDGVGWLQPSPLHFTPGKETQYALCRRLCGPEDRSKLVRKTSPPPEFDPRTVQQVASRYTDYAILAFEQIPFLANYLPVSLCWVRMQSHM